MFKKVIPIGVALALVLSVTACSSSKPAADETQMPASSSDFSTEKYQEVVSDLSGAGFTNVKANPLGDLIVNLFHKPGDVKEISVNGSKEDFDKGATYKKNARIVVGVPLRPRWSVGGAFSIPISLREPVRVAVIQCRDRRAYCREQLLTLLRF